MLLNSLLAAIVRTEAESRMAGSVGRIHVVIYRLWFDSTEQRDIRRYTNDKGKEVSHSDVARNKE